MPEYFVLNGDDEEERSYEVETLEDGRYRVVTPEGDEHVVDAFEPEGGRLHLLVEHDSYDLAVRRTDDSFAVNLEGHSHEFDVLNERQMRMRTAGVGGRGADTPDLVSPMAGKVVSVVADADQEVEEGETVVIVEAMKMENDLKAHRAGPVTEIHVEAGDAVEIGDALVSIGE